MVATRSREVLADFLCQTYLSKETANVPVNHEPLDASTVQVSLPRSFVLNENMTENP